jgi:hypothetical protein
MNTRERGLRSVGLWTAALAAVGVAGSIGVVAAVHSADAATTSSTESSTSDSGAWSGGDVSSGSGQAQAHSGGS